MRLNSYFNGKIQQIGFALLTLIVFAPVASAQSSDAPLSNAAVVRLVKAGFKEKTIITIISSRPNNFKLDTEQLIQLKQSGVSENIILVMLSQNGSLFGNEDDWGSEPFFKDSKKNAGVYPTDPSPNNGSVDIFGSGSGSKSESRSRGSGVGNQNESNVTGSATVRILRPPAEAGAAGAPKLEKTPTLNNDSVIKLVEAGFSEGTIIKRIEDSPADFDLSPAKLEELRRRRVSDTVISAMTTAMSDGTGDKPTTPF